MRLGAGIIYYNDAFGIKRNIDSLITNFDKVYCIEGRYAGFDKLNNSEFSTDGSIEVVRKYSDEYPDKIVIQTITHANEARKRQAYLYLAAADLIDFLLVIDADEYVYRANWSKLRAELARKAKELNEKKLNIVGARMTDYPFETECIRPRWFYRPHELMYALNKHDKFYRQDDTTPEKLSAMTQGKTEHIVIGHDNTYRSKERLEAERYYAMTPSKH